MRRRQSWTCSYANASKAKFSPKIKIGSKTYKPGKVVISRNVFADEVTIVEATDAISLVYAQKKSDLVKEGGKLEKFVGYKTDITVGKNYYKVSILNGDKAKLLYPVRGQAFMASGQLLVRSVKVADVDEENATYNLQYEVYACFFNTALKNGFCAVLFKLTVGDSGEIENTSISFLN